MSRHVRIYADCNSSVVTFYDINPKVVDFANSIDPDEVAHDEPPHLDLHCLPL